MNQFLAATTVQLLLLRVLLTAWLFVFATTATVSSFAFPVPFRNIAGRRRCCSCSTFPTSNNNGNNRRNQQQLQLQQIDRRRMMLLSSATPSNDQHRPQHHPQPHHHNNDEMSANAYESISLLSNSNSSSLRVGIAGAGAVAFGMASILSKNGHRCLLWSPSGKGTADLLQRDEDNNNNDINDRTITSTGALHHKFVPAIASSAQQLVRESDVLIVALPANGHKQVFDALAPHLVSSTSASSTSNSAKHIIVSSHASFGALYLSQILHKLNSHRHHQHTITSWGTTVCTARRTSGRIVDIKTIRKSVDTCCFCDPDPHEDGSSSSTSSQDICKRLFPDTEFRPREGLLAITLSNLNPQNHLAIALGNIGRMDNGEEWYQFKNITPRIGSFLEALDRERLEIASVLGLDVKTVYDHFSLSFHVPVPKSKTGDSLSEMCGAIYEKGNDVHGPTTAIDSRYVTEDVPFGLAPVVALGKLVGRPAVLHESGLNICNAMYGRDFSAENDLLEAIGLLDGNGSDANDNDYGADRIGLDELKEAARTGRLRSRLVSKKERTESSRVVLESS